MLLQRILKLGKMAQKYLRRPRNVGRKRSTEWCDKDMTEMGDTEFIANFRLLRSAFKKLCQELATGIKKKNTFARNTFSVQRRTAMTLYFLGQGLNYRAVANQFDVALSIVCCIVRETRRRL